MACSKIQIDTAHQPIKHKTVQNNVRSQTISTQERDLFMSFGRTRIKQTKCTSTHKINTHGDVILRDQDQTAQNALSDPDPSTSIPVGSMNTTCKHCMFLHHITQQDIYSTPTTRENF